MADEQDRQTCQSIRVVTNSRIIYQGRLQTQSSPFPSPSFLPSPAGCENRFIFVQLECLPVVIAETGTVPVLEPLPIFRVGDVVKINLNEAVFAITTSSCIL